MAVRGVYTEALATMVAETEKLMDTAVGWTRPPAAQVATAEAMKNFAFGANPWNPLFHDEKYAAGTRWAGLIAYPMFQNSFPKNSSGPVKTPECGFDYQLWPGHNWEFLRPIRPGDSIRVWNRRGQLKDVTPKDGKGQYSFVVKGGCCDFINQKDELVSTLDNWTYRIYYPGGPPKTLPMPEYGYTQEELEYLDRLVRAEEVRGANIRWWEDINIGDEIRPVVLGPTSLSLNAVIGSVNTIGGRLGMGSVPPRELLHEDADGKLVGDFVQDPSTGLFYACNFAGRHWSDREAHAQGEPIAFLFGLLSVYTMLRLIINWMGDDGFLRRYCWRHITRTPNGDALVGRGKVTNKRVDNGEHLVDLMVWLLNMRNNNITEAASATVSLLSKESSLQWK